ncbi:hypothetical protein [Leucobacter sp. W1478]|uniref:hypothetical protein n=1 Tax=Leucobacter sp. W1478 TaxID=3439065 RepID=UPI003F2A489A
MSRGLALRQRLDQVELPPVRTLILVQVSVFCALADPHSSKRRVKIVAAQPSGADVAFPRCGNGERASEVARKW